MTLYEPHTFKQTMRMHKDTFEMLCDELRPHMERETTNLKQPVAVEKRVAIGIYHYANGGTYTRTAEQFCVSSALAHRCVVSFIAAMICVHADLIHLPTEGPELQRIIQGFESKRQMPNCFGAIDCTHFLITAPYVKNRRAYYDKTKNMSVVMQAVVDSQGRFMDVVTGLPGSVNDKRIFAECDLRDILRTREMLCEPVVKLDGLLIKPYLVGDAGYTSEPFNVIPYPGWHLTPNQERFNFWHSSTRMIVEQAFGRLKGRFRWLNGVLHVTDAEKHAEIIVAGCILHNWLMDRSDRYDVNWSGGVKLRCGNQIATGNGDDVSANAVRNALCKHMLKMNRRK